MFIWFKLKGCFRAIAIAAFLCSLSLIADESLSQWVHTQWQTDRGLPQNSVFCFAEDRDGFLWFGTESGLVRFDGVAFKIYTQQSSPSIQHNFVSCLLVASDGSLWAGARTGGLSRYTDGRFEVPFPELLEERVFSLAQTPDGTIWVGTARGLRRIDGSSLSAPIVNAGFPRGRINALCTAADGSLLIGAFDGTFSRCTDGKIQTYANPLATRQTAVTAIAEDKASGIIWIAYDGEGLVRFSGGSFTRVDLSGRELEYLQALLVDSEGAVWVGTEHDGIARYKEGDICVLNSQDGLNTDSVLALARDRHGSIWAGMLFGGLHRLNHGTFSTFGRREGLPAEGITCVIEVEPGKLLVGTKTAGLVRKKNFSFEAVATPGLSKEIRALLKSREGDIWVGGKDGGVLRLKGTGQIDSFRTTEGLVANDATLFYQARSGDIWIGTQRSGISVLNPSENRVTRVFTNEVLRTYIRCVVEDPAGAVWIGTQNGLAKYSSGSIEAIDLGRFSTESIRALLPAGDNTLWIGTRDEGLLHFSENKLFHFEAQHGLFHRRIYQLLRVGGQLWIAGNRGVELAPLADLSAIASGKSSRVSSRLFTERDGLRTVECSGDSTPAAIESSDGTLWFATRRGLSAVKATGIRSVQPAPEVLIEEVRLDKAGYRAKGFKTIPAGTTRVRFSFTAPALTEGLNVLCRYRLEGVDKDWIDAGHEREAVYYNLPPGGHRFRVAASDGLGVWSTNETSLAFSVLPHLYQTPWFYGFWGLLGAGSVLGVYRWRVSGIQRRNETLESLVQVRTKELEEEVAQRKKAEEEQIALNSALEERVQERTFQLSDANATLQAELCERQRVEQELAASEGRLRRVVDSGMVGILFWDRNGLILDANDTFLRMIGFTREELLAGCIQWTELTPPEYLQFDRSALEEISATGVCAPFEKEYIRKDGSRFPVLLGGASLLPDASQGVCFVLDISERKASEEKVRTLAQSLELRVQERTQELARINQQLANEVLERKRVAVALSAFSQLGQKLHGSHTEAEAANTIALAAKSLIPHERCSIDLYGLDSKLYPVLPASRTEDDDGEPMRSHISVPIRNGSRVIGIIGLKSSAVDSFKPSDANTLQALGDYCGGALDRIHAEEARRETERRFVAFMANAPALAWMKDSQLRYVFTNPMFQKFIGLPGEEIDGKSDAELWPAGAAARVRNNDLAVFTGETTIQTEETLTRAEGEESRTLLTFRFPFKTAGGERFIAGMAIDITEQKRAEQALHHLPQAILEAQEQERHRLARELHDGVNQAIASVKFRIQTAEKQILRGDLKWQDSCSKSKEMLDSVLHQVRRLSHNLRPGELDDLGLMAAARTAFREFEERTGIIVEFAAMGLEERLDPTLESTFYRIIQEGLTNIEKHSSATVVKVKVVQNEMGVTLEIFDNGIGFDSAEVQNRRSGLGLLHMRERANLVGASLSIVTAPGDGVRLLMVVPKHREEGSLQR